jgi:hypothetical protein
MDTSILKYKLQQKIAGKITNNLITEAVLLKADQVPEQPDQGMSWMDWAMYAAPWVAPFAPSAFRWLRGLRGARGLGRGGIQTPPRPGTSPQTRITGPEPKSTTPQNQKTPRKSPNPAPGTNPARDTNPAPGRTNSGRHKPRRPNSGTPHPTRIGTEVGEEVVEKGAKEVGEEVVEKAAKEVGEKVVEKAAKEVGEKVGKEVVETGAIAVGKEVAKDALLKNVKDNIAKKLVAKSLGKVAAKKLPFGVGLLAGAGLAVVSAASGDWEQAGYDLASGTLSTVPVAGTAGSVAIDAWAIKRQLDKLNNMTPEELQKMSDELDTEEKSEKAAENAKMQAVLQHKPSDPVRFTPGKI